MSSWQSGTPTPPRTKRDMLADLPSPPAQSRLAAKNTLDYTMPDGTRGVLLHRTKILEIRPDGSFTVNTGGYNTKTTRARLNDFLPDGWTVYTDKARARIRNRNTDAAAQFLTTVAVTRKGAIRPDRSAAQLNRLTALVDRAMAKLKTEGMPRPSAGDPWVWEPSQVIGETMLDWLKTQYLTAPLVIMAYKFSGFRDEQLRCVLPAPGAKLDRRALRTNSTLHPLLHQPRELRR